MPFTGPSAGGDSGAMLGSGELRLHDDHLARSAYASEEYFALTRAPIPIPQAMKIPKAKEAVDKEWNKAFSRSAWLI